MAQYIRSVKGVTGNYYHYDEFGRYVGESRPGIVEGSWNHINADNSLAGRTDPGIIADGFHYDADNALVGYSVPGLLGQEKTFFTDGGVADTWSDTFGASTFFDF